MNSILNKIASVLAFVIGGMAVVAGGKVLLGIDPGYYVIDWLPVYNYTVGILTIFVGAALIWKNSRFALPFAIGSLTLHAIVMLVLQTTYSGVVAAESIKAMIVRLTAWTIILVLVAAQARRQHSGADRPGRLVQV